MTDRDALIERVKAAEKSATHRERNTGGDGNAVVSLYDLRALISLASPSPAQWPEDVVERAARAHYDHHYGTGEFDNLPIKTKKRLVYRMRAALATLPPPVKGLVEAAELWLERAKVEDDRAVIEFTEAALASYRGGA